MFKKIELWAVFLLIIIFLITIILFGSIIKHSYEYPNSNKYKILKKVSLFIASYPENLIKIFNPHGKYLSNNKNFISKKSFFNVYQKGNNNNLILISRYDGDKKKHQVELYDLNNFLIINRWEIKKNENIELFTNISFNKLRILDPILIEDGSIVFNLNPGPLLKLDRCNNLKIINNDLEFHHSNNINDNIFWVPSYEKKKVVIDGIFFNKLENITGINKDGEIIFKKNLYEIFDENNIRHLFFLNWGYNDDPTHLNDIEIAKSTKQFWNKGDIFISLRSLSEIMHYRPSTGKIINRIKGNFINQHDIDIISDYQISIFDNDVIFNERNSENPFYNKIKIYNFKTRKIEEYLPEYIKKYKPTTITSGSHHIDKKNGIYIEDNNNGRLFYLDKEGNLLWEYINKSKDNKIFRLSWFKVIEDKSKINYYKKLFKSDILC